MSSTEDLTEKQNSSSGSIDNEGENVSTTPIATSNAANPNYNPKFKNVLELGVFIFFFAINMSGSVFQNQLLYQTCRYVYNYDVDFCAPFITSSTEDQDFVDAKNEIQVYVSKIVATNSVINAVIPAVLSLFIGPWSDKFGRRPIILTIFIAYLLNVIIFCILSTVALQNAFSPWLYLLPSIPTMLTGGTCALITIAFSYITDIAEGRMRAFRILMMEAYMGIGAIVGSTVAGYILPPTNFPTIFGIAGILLIVANIYGFFLIIESIETQAGSRLREFFRLELVVDILRTAFKARPKKSRTIIWLSIGALIVSAFISAGETSVFYLFVTNKIQWTLQNFNIYTIVSSTVFVAGGVTGVIVLRKHFNCTLAVINCISYASAFLQSLIRAFAAYTWEIYVGVVAGFMFGVPMSMLFGLLSSVTPPTETAKIFAISNALRTLVPLGAAPLYTLIYDSAINTYPGAFNFLSAGLYICAFLMMIAVYIIQKKLTAKSPSPSSHLEGNS